MSYAVVAVLIALVSLFLHGVAVRVIAGIVLICLFVLFLVHARQSNFSGRQVVDGQLAVTRKGWQRFAFALTGAAAVIGVWNILIAVLHVTHVA